MTCDVLEPPLLDTLPTCLSAAATTTQSRSDKHMMHNRVPCSGHPSCNAAAVAHASRLCHLRRWSVAVSPLSPVGCGWGADEARAVECRVMRRWGRCHAAAVVEHAAAADVSCKCNRFLGGKSAGLLLNFFVYLPTLHFTFFPPFFTVIADPPPPPPLSSPPHLLRACRQLTRHQI